LEEKEIGEDESMETDEGHFEAIIQNVRTKRLEERGGTSSKRQHNAKASY